MAVRTLVLNPVEPVLLSLRAPLGVDLDLNVTFLAQNTAPVDPNTLMPQLALLPRTMGGVFGYDLDTISPAQGIGHVLVPGSALTDRNGYNLELYQRRPAVAEGDPPVATGLLAKGVLRLDGAAYQQLGPFYMINVPVTVGPAGPQGIQGEQGQPGTVGQRGSIWTTGSGAPIAMGGELPGDMYLQDNGDVWRFDGATWAKGTF